MNPDYRKESDPELKTILRKLGQTMIHNILVSNDLVDLYLKDPYQAVLKIEEIIDINEYSEAFVKEYICIVDDFIQKKEWVLKKLDVVDESDKDELLMILFYAVSSFESMVNLFLFSELELKDLSKTDIQDILRLDMDRKVSWLLKLVCGFRYTDNKNWSLLRRFVQTRNFFIHFKPVTWEQEDIHSKLLNKKSINDFMIAAYDCYLYLNERHNEKYKDRTNKFEQLQEFELNFKKV